MQVAQIVKSYSTTGEVVVKLLSNALEEIKGPVFIYFDELPVPFFISNITYRGNSGAIIKFTTINDFSHSQELLKKGVYIDKNSLNNIDDYSIENSDSNSIAEFIIGFKLYNSNNNHIGEVTDFYNYPNNPCIEVNNSILIPFHTDLIIDFNPNEQTITMQIPNGLL